MPVSDNNLTLRDRMKVACLNCAISAGLNEEEMIHLFTTGAKMLRESQDGDLSKEAGVLGTLVGGGVGLAALAALFGGLGIAALGNTVGRTAGDLVAGQSPSGDELRLTDEIASYERNTDEVLARIKDRKAKEALRSKPSVRRMF
jgi:hypothetical protein